MSSPKEIIEALTPKGIYLPESLMEEAKWWQNERESDFRALVSVLEKSLDRLEANLKHQDDS